MGEEARRSVSVRRSAPVSEEQVQGLGGAFVLSQARTFLYVDGVPRDAVKSNPGVQFRLPRGLGLSGAAYHREPSPIRAHHELGCICAGPFMLGHRSRSRKSG